VAETHPIFLGDSRAVIKGFPKSVKENFGGELQRLLDGENPLDSAPMGHVLPGVFELRDEDKDFWYRVLYYRRDGAVYVLHCFTKKTNKTSQGDVEIARKRLSDLKKHLAKTKKD
jgi:phage-related protein